jgi:hypothetical protein
MSRLHRAQHLQAPLYCSRACSGLGRRRGKTTAERVEAKRRYDANYRTTHKEVLKKKKQRYWATHKHLQAPKQKVYRQTHRAAHTAYCQQPAYKAYKQGYDRQHRAKEYGPMAEAVLVLWALEAEIRQRAMWAERASFKGTLNKAQQRRRAL